MLTSKVDDFFELSARGSGVRTEIVAGISVFLSMAYVVVVNPAILAQGGIPWSAAFVATILVSGLATVAMGLWARLPFVLAPGMEMNAYVAYFVIGVLGFNWHQALGIVFWSGVIFLLTSASGLRAKFIESIPESMKAALSLSVGVFILLIALKICGVLEFSGARIVGIGNFLGLQAVTLCLSIALILFLERLGIIGSVLIAVLGAAFLLHFFGHTEISKSHFRIAEAVSGIVSLDVTTLIKPAALSAIIVLFLIDFFGSVAKFIGLSAGTSISVDGKLPRLRRGLLVDATASIVGSLAGTSNITVYVESGVGIAAGGRTGLSALICGAMLLLCLPFGFLISYLPIAATAPALAYVFVKLCPSSNQIRLLSLFDRLVLLAMLVAVVVWFSIDKALLVGATLHVGRSLFLRRVPNAYLLTSVVLLSLGSCLQ